MYLNKNYEDFESANIHHIIFFYILFIISLIIIFIYQNNKISIIKQSEVFSINNSSIEIIITPKKESYIFKKSPKKKKIQSKDFINKYLKSIPSKYDLDKEYEKTLLTNFFSLQNLSKNKTLNEKYIKQIIEKIKIDYKKNFLKLESVFIQNPIAFGNTIICLNNVIFYCEIIGCKNIYLNSSYNWYIKNNINSNKLNIAIMPSSEINCKDSNILCMPFEGGLCINPLFIKQKIRVNILKDEIQRNLPKVNIDPNDLYIHIRSGDIFNNSINPSYSQPPLCFYEKILHKFNFKNIYIISENKNNPVIEKLLSKYPNIIFKTNSIEKDFAYISNAYNLVGSVSSFSLAALKLNNNLKNYWEYDLYRLHSKYLHLHYDIYEIPRNFTIYKMKPSTEYRKEMFAWRKEKNQLDLMINEKCRNNFYIIE